MSTLATMIPGLVNAGVGMFQMSQAGKMPDGSKELPAGYDPMLLNYISTIRKRQSQLRSGTDPMSSVLLNEIQGQNADVMANVFKTGNASLINNTLETIKRQQGETMGKVAASTNAAADALENNVLQPTMTLAENNKQLSFWKAFQQLRRKEELMQTGQTNLGAGVGDALTSGLTALMAKKK